MPPTPQRAAVTGELKPCPFCGGAAELDTMRGYRALVSGKLGNAVAIYCIACSAEICFCREDMPDLTTEDLIYMAREFWNRRATLSPGDDHERMD